MPWIADVTRITTGPVRRLHVVASGNREYTTKKHPESANIPVQAAILNFVEVTFHSKIAFCGPCSICPIIKFGEDTINHDRTIIMT